MHFIVWIVGALIVLCLLFWFSGTKQSDEELSAEMQRARDGLTAELYRELKDLVEQRRKIEAIKRLRAETGVGLYVAKKVIDEL